MFKQLRQRLLLMNLIMISIVMLIAFSTIYYMTYREINLAISLELQRESTLGDMGDSEDRMPPGDGNTSGIKDGHKKDLEKLDERGGERAVTFSLNVDEAGNILNTNSIVERENIFYEEILNLVLESEEIEGQQAYDNNEWSFLVTENQGMFRYSFVDMTTEQAVLDRLVYTFVGVSIFTFLMILVISNILTNRSLLPIRKAFDQQKRFISDASHELKTPLAVIGANVDVLLDSEQGAEDKKWLHYIRSEVERMGKLTNDLLYLTQVENDEGHEVLHTETFVNDHIESMMLGLDAVCYEKKISLDYEMDEDLKFKGNSEQFVQMVLILMDNAIKYTPEGGSVQMSLRKNHHNMTLSVKNTGAGISSEEMPFLFDRFYRVDKARNRREGSYGLGLSIAKAIVDQHKGKITCESIPSQETVFTVVLPL